MVERTKEAYRFRSWPTPSQRDASLIFRGFSPWPEDCGAWILDSREVYESATSRRLVRTIWNNPSNNDERILVDTYESASLDLAREYLIHILDKEELALPPNSPLTLGDISFAHPDGYAPAYFWVFANVCIRVNSFGKKFVDVSNCARRIAERMKSDPVVPPEGMLITMRARPNADPQEVEVIASLPWELGDFGYRKFVAFGGRLILRDGRLILTRWGTSDAFVSALAAEPLKHPLGGQLSSPG